MKTFEVRESRLRHLRTLSCDWRSLRHHFEFHCYERECSQCRLRFLCFTNKNVIIHDSSLVAVLYEMISRKNDGRRARKYFFKYLLDYMGMIQ